MEHRVAVRGRARATPGSSGPAAAHQDSDLRPAQRPDPEDPFPVLIDTWLDPATPSGRWAVVAGDGAAAQRALDDPAARRDLLVVRTGQPEADALLADLAPVLGRLLDDLTPSQRRLTRLLLVDELRQADAAAVLGISRASVSVARSRARVRELELLLRAIRAAWTAGLRLSDGDSRPSLDRGATVPR